MGEEIEDIMFSESYDLPVLIQKEKAEIKELTKNLQEEQKKSDSQLAQYHDVSCQSAHYRNVVKKYQALLFRGGIRTIRNRTSGIRILETAPSL